MGSAIFEFKYRPLEVARKAEEATQIRSLALWAGGLNSTVQLQLGGEHEACTMMVREWNAQGDKNVLVWMVNVPYWWTVNSPWQAVLGVLQCADGNHPIQLKFRARISAWGAVVCRISVLWTNEYFVLALSSKIITHGRDGMVRWYAKNFGGFYLRSGESSLHI